MSLLPYLWLPQDTGAVRRHNTTTLEGRLGGFWADAAARTGNPDAALARYRQLLRWHPADMPLYDGIDALLRRQPEHWDPTVLWGQIAAAHADQPYARAKFAVALTDAGRFPEALSELQRITDKVGLRTYLCDAYLGAMLKSGDLTGARNYLRWCRDNDGPLSRAAVRAAERTLGRAGDAVP
jgi:tetratricopeptide (TPR) repeat protein